MEALRRQVAVVTTIDLEPARFLSLERGDHDEDDRAAFVRMFALTTSGVSMAMKE
ncbi:hypothetical protein GCM10022235_67020 [Kribbella ginsengisoli]|uniref:Uncharacterized protein n=1 Tax=Kribbella ginsengisoli TaxID=363865 RepID=A0ABP6YNB7_9ACTN